MRNHWARHVAFQRACRRYSSFASPSIRPHTTPVRSLQWKSLTTLFYSTVMATACAADAHSKQQRRKIWDQRIMELEEKLGIDRPSSAGTATAEDNHGLDTDISSSDTSVQNALRTPSATQRGNRMSLGVGVGPKEPHSELREQYQMSSSSANPIDLAKLFRPLAKGMTTVYMTTDYKPRSLSIAPGSILADRIYGPRESRPRARNWTWKKLINAETAVAQMTTRMMLHAAKSSPHATDPRSETAHHIRHYKANLRILHERLQIIKSLKNTDDAECVERMQYPQYKRPPRGARTWAEDLNKSIQDLLTKHSLKHFSDEQVISRLVYNLMISKQIPDNHTFTSLISYFTRIGKHDLASILVRGLDASNIREDEMSVNAVLTHYIRSRDRPGFLKYAERMRGLHGGLFLANPHAAIGPESNVRLSKKHGKVQCIEEDRPIFTSLIHGYLAFGKFSTAMQTYQRMVARGFEPDSRVFSSFLHFFSRAARHHKSRVANRDEVWAKGLATWNALKAIREQSGLSSEDFFMTSAYDNMLALCQSCNRTEEYERISKERRAEQLSEDQLPWFHKDMRHQRSVQRKLREMENILVRIEDDLRKANARVVASKLFQAGEPMSKIQQAFEQASEGLTHDPWWEESLSRSAPSDLGQVGKALNDVVAVNAPASEQTKTDVRSTTAKAKGQPEKDAIRETGSHRALSSTVTWRPHAIPPHLTAQQWSTADRAFATA